MDLSTMAQFNLKSPEQLFAAFAKFSESNKESTATDQTDNESYSRSLSPEVKSEDCKMEIDENCNNNEMALQSILGDDNSFAAELFKNVAQSQMDESTTPTKNAGYRAELKRPDLKGQFRCTICNKVFCHSSSLSRHRMQAHFKSYTCTLCSKEITSNETLRAHMLKQHQISRMFMCRCCNWAFPDKTSLHMHMQGKSDGTKSSLNVPVIGKGLPPISSPPSQTLNFGNTEELFNNVLAAQLNNQQLRNAFPALNPMNLGMRMNPTAVSTSFGSSVIKPGITSPLTPSSTASGASCDNPQNSLFPQLSMIPRDNADLFLKLRDRLLLNNLWLPGSNVMNMPFGATGTEGAEGSDESNAFNFFNPTLFANQLDSAKNMATQSQEALQNLMQQILEQSIKSSNDNNNNVEDEKEVKVDSDDSEHRTSFFSAEDLIDRSTCFDRAANSVSSLDRKLDSASSLDRAMNSDSLLHRAKTSVSSGSNSASPVDHGNVRSPDYTSEGFERSSEYCTEAVNSVASSTHNEDSESQNHMILSQNRSLNHLNNLQQHRLNQSPESSHLSCLNNAMSSLETRQTSSSPYSKDIPNLEIQTKSSASLDNSSGHNFSASPTNSNSSTSPNSACFDCQVAKNKLVQLSMEINKIREQKSQADLELSEKNEALANRLAEIRSRLVKFMEESDAAENVEFVKEIMKFTMLQ